MSGNSAFDQLKIHTDPQNGEFHFPQVDPKKNKIIDTPRKMGGAIHVSIVEGRNLLATDVNHYSDPQFKLKLLCSDEKKAAGTIHKKTLNPVATNDVFTLNIPKIESFLKEQLLIKVYDHDKGRSDDILGYVYIPLNALQYLGIISGWHCLYSPVKNKNGGYDRRPGQIYVYIVVDRYTDKSSMQIQNNDPILRQRFITRRNWLIDLAKRVEEEASASLYKRIAFDAQQKQKELDYKAKKAHRTSIVGSMPSGGVSRQNSRHQNSSSHNDDNSRNSNSQHHHHHHHHHHHGNHHVQTSSPDNTGLTSSLRLVDNNNNELVAPPPTTPLPPTPRGVGDLSSTLLSPSTTSTATTPTITTPSNSIFDTHIAYKNIVYYNPSAMPYDYVTRPAPIFTANYPSFICSPLQHPHLDKLVPIDCVSEREQSILKVPTLGGLTYLQNTDPTNSFIPGNHSQSQNNSNSNNINNINNNYGPTRAMPNTTTTPSHFSNDNVLLPLVAYELTLCVATWNVGNAPPPENPAQLRQWLRGEADIVVIGTQENLYNVPRPKPGQPKWKNHLEHWTWNCQKALGDTYELLHYESLGQMLLQVFIKKNIRPYVDTYQPITATVATGLLNGTLPNKGGQCIALSILGTSFAFISSHLAAHTSKNAKRIEDIQSIVKGISFKGPLQHTNPLNAFNHVIWCGDLNFRTLYCGPGDHPDEEKYKKMHELMNNQEYEPMLQQDQLLSCMAENKGIFSGFNDCPPKFAPTFKVKRDSLDFYNPERCSSWTDRILYKSQRGYAKQIQFVNFESQRNITTSDHKPVSAVFKIFPSFPTVGVSPSLCNVTLHITKLMAFNLPTGYDLNGKADPYVKFSGPCLKESVSTIPKYSTLSPMWSEQDLVKTKLLFSYTSEARLWESMINLTVFDDNKTRRDTFLCSGVFSFKSDDIVALLHHGNQPIDVNNASSRLERMVGTNDITTLQNQQSQDLSSSSPLSPTSPSTYTLKMDKETNQSFVEIIRDLQLFDAEGRLAGNLIFIGHLTFSHVERPKMDKQAPQNIQKIQQHSKR